MWPGVTRAREFRIFAVGRGGVKRMKASGNSAPNDLEDRKIVLWANSWRGEVNKIDPWRMLSRYSPFSLTRSSMCIRSLKGSFAIWIILHGCRFWFCARNFAQHSLFLTAMILLKDLLCCLYCFMVPFLPARIIMFLPCWQSWSHHFLLLWFTLFSRNHCPVIFLNASYALPNSSYRYGSLISSSFYCSHLPQSITL